MSFEKIRLEHGSIGVNLVRNNHNNNSNNNNKNKEEEEEEDEGEEEQRHQEEQEQEGRRRGRVKRRTTRRRRRNVSAVPWLPQAYVVPVAGSVCASHASCFEEPPSIYNKNNKRFIF